jgi:hypothetical protein
MADRNKIYIYLSFVWQTTIKYIFTLVLYGRSELNKGFMTTISHFSIANILARAS